MVLSSQLAPDLAFICYEMGILYVILEYTNLCVIAWREIKTSREGEVGISKGIQEEKWNILFFQHFRAFTNREA